MRLRVKRETWIRLHTVFKMFSKVWRLRFSRNCKREAARLCCFTPLSPNFLFNNNVRVLPKGEEKKSWFKWREPRCNNLSSIWNSSSKGPLATHALIKIDAIDLQLTCAFLHRCKQNRGLSYDFAQKSPGFDLASKPKCFPYSVVFILPSWTA